MGTIETAREARGTPSAPARSTATRLLTAPRFLAATPLAGALRLGTAVVAGLAAVLAGAVVLGAAVPAAAQEASAEEPSARAAQDAAPRARAAQEAAEEEAAVLAALDTFFEAMAAGDSAAFAAVQVPEGMTFSQRLGPGGPHPVRIRDQASLAAGIGAGERLLERIWDPEVRVHGPLAAVWTPYDFHVNGSFSHCGVDLFTLFRIEGKWKITGASWTVETEGCEPSPLGPPGAPADAGLPDEARSAAGGAAGPDAPAAGDPEGGPPSALRAAASRVIDASGRYLIPGLWDAHVHFRGGEELREENRALLRLYVANGVTTVRDAGGDLTEALLEWRRRIATGELTGPRILTSGPKLDGPTGGWPGSIRIEDPAGVPAALDSLGTLGTEYVKIYDGSVFREVYLAIVREAERRGRTVSGHMPFSVGFREAVEAGLDITDHLYYAFKGGSAVEDSLTRLVARGEGPGFWQALDLLRERRDPERERALFGTMAARGTAVVPTLHIGEILARVEEVDHSGDPELRYIHPAVEATYAGRVRSARRSPPEARRRLRELRATLSEMVPRLHDAGVILLAGSDAGPFNSYVYPGFSLHAELEALVEAGLTPAEALRAATVAPARVMGLGDRLGRVQAGYEADLVLLGANPLEDIRATRRIDRVILRGREVLDAADLRALLEGVARGG